MIHVLMQNECADTIHFLVAVLCINNIIKKLNRITYRPLIRPLILWNYQFYIFYRLAIPCLGDPIFQQQITYGCYC